MFEITKKAGHKSTCRVIWAQLKIIFYAIGLCWSISRPSLNHVYFCVCVFKVHSGSFFSPKSYSKVHFISFKRIHFFLTFDHKKVGKEKKSWIGSCFTSFTFIWLGTEKLTHWSLHIFEKYERSLTLINTLLSLNVIGLSWSAFWPEIIEFRMERHKQKWLLLSHDLFFMDKTTCECNIFCRLNPFSQDARRDSLRSRLSEASSFSTLLFYWLFTVMFAFLSGFMLYLLITLLFALNLACLFLNCILSQSLVKCGY